MKWVKAMIGAVLHREHTGMPTSTTIFPYVT